MAVKFKYQVNKSYKMTDKSSDQISSTIEKCDEINARDKKKKCQVNEDSTMIDVDQIMELLNSNSDDDCTSEESILKSPKISSISSSTISKRSRQDSNEQTQENIQVNIQSEDDDDILLLKFIEEYERNSKRQKTF